MDTLSVFILLASSAITFFLARKLGKRFRARRDAERAERTQRDLAQQSRQVRRAAARKKKG